MSNSIYDYDDMFNLRRQFPFEVEESQRLKKPTYNNDLNSFLDGGSKVPFRMNEGKYIPTPSSIIETLEFDNKLYYNSHSGYFVGTRLSTVVRSITPQDYRFIQAEVKKIENDTQLINKTQLIMDFC